MPASLMSENSLAYANRVNPWHQLGVPMECDGMTAMEALALAKLDYKVHKIRPVLPMPDGTLREADAYYYLMREPVPAHKFTDWEEIGTCSSKYTLLQNAEIAQILDDSGITKKWKVITMGALGKGDRFFASLDSGRFSVAGEETQGVVSILDDKGGNSALKIIESLTTIVCLNTYMQADASAQMSASIPHTSRIKADFEWKAQLFKQVFEAQQSFKQIAETMAHQKVNVRQFQALLATIYPMPKVPEAVVIAKEVDEKDQLTNMVAKELLGATVTRTAKVGGDPIARFERERSRVTAMREAIGTEYALTCQERPKIAGSKWAVFNSITGAIDHAPRFGHTTNAALRAERATIDGKHEAGIKVQAFNLLQGDLDDLLPKPQQDLSIVGAN